MTTPMTATLPVAPVATVATSPATTVKVTTQEHKECLGHRDSVGTTKTREKVRVISEKKLDKFQDDKNIKADTCFTEMTVTQNSKKKDQYEVFMKYFHNDDVTKCDHFQNVSLETRSPVVAVKA